MARSPVQRRRAERAIDAAERDLITPILIDPEKKIRAVAASEGDIAPYRLVPTDHSHHAAEVAVAMVRAGEARDIDEGQPAHRRAAARVKKEDWSG